MFIHRIILLHVCFAAILFSAESPEIRTTLSEEEAFAFKAVFGTSDMKKLLEIERDPLAYWNEREKALKDEAIPHREFCMQYAKQAQELLTIIGSQGHQRWFCHPNTIKDIIAAKISQDHPAFPTVLALYTAAAHDHISNPTATKFQFMQTEMEFSKELDSFLFAKVCGLTKEFNDKQLWVIRDNAKVSMFDSLVALSNGHYLCGAAPAEQRLYFESHKFDRGAPAFYGYSGPISLESLNHALKQYLWRFYLRRHHISFEEYFGLCWNKEKLIKNNIIDLAQLCMGCLYQFRELPSVDNLSAYGKTLFLVFPKTFRLTDPIFWDITPYFISYPHIDCARPWNHPCVNWSQERIRPHIDDTHQTLLAWASQHCSAAGHAMVRQSKEAFTKHRLITS